MINLTTETEKSTREIAEQITIDVAKICGCNWESCTAVRSATKDAIYKALRDRDERAAAIVERARENETGPYLNALASAIRGK